MTLEQIKTEINGLAVKNDPLKLQVLTIKASVLLTEKLILLTEALQENSEIRTKQELTKKGDLILVEHKNRVKLSRVKK